jgi:hypothetical protein
VSYLPCDTCKGWTLDARDDAGTLVCFACRTPHRCADCDGVLNRNHECPTRQVIPVPTWTETDDNSDPCIYCVQWFTPEQFANLPDADDDPERMAPYMPDGPASRLYQHVHARCAEAVALHISGAIQ